LKRLLDYREDRASDRFRTTITRNDHADRSFHQLFRQNSLPGRPESEEAFFPAIRQPNSAVSLRAVGSPPFFFRNRMWGICNTYLNTPNINSNSFLCIFSALLSWLNIVDRSGSSIDAAHHLNLLTKEALQS